MQRNTSFLKKLIYVQNHIRKYSKPKEKEIQKHRAVVVGKHSEAPTAPQSSNDKTPSKVASCSYISQIMLFLCVWRFFYSFKPEQLFLTPFLAQEKGLTLLEVNKKLLANKEGEEESSLLSPLQIV
jgi:hypothetical protein